MAGIFQGDILIKTAIELGMDDMRKNPWLIDHMLSDLVSISYVTDKYGQKQIDACKEWFANNQVDIYMATRTDKDRTPCITISMGPSPEKEGMKSMADQSTESMVLMPNQIGKPIPFVVKPFVPTGYDPAIGQVYMDPSTKGLETVVEGMVLVDPATGTGFMIEDVNANGIVIEPNIQIEAAQLAVVPQFAYYMARVEHTFFQDTYKIGCHAHGDPQVMLWLHSIVLYSILRYRESLLEANGFAESIVSSGDLQEDESFTGAGGEQGFVRYITLTGQVENSWVKSPRRFIEAVVIKDRNASTFTGGIKILTNFDPPDFIDKTQETWFTNADPSIAGDDDSEDQGEDS